MTQLTDYEKALTFAYKTLKLRPLSQKELTIHLIKKGFSCGIADSVIEKLSRQKLLNDREFVYGIFETRKARTPKALKMIKERLAKKGIDEDIVTPVYEQFKNSLDVEKEILDLARKKSQQLKKSGKKNIFQKTGAYLFREGFEEDLIRQVLEKIGLSTKELF